MRIYPSRVVVVAALCTACHGAGPTATGPTDTTSNGHSKTLTGSLPSRGDIIQDLHVGGAGTLHATLTWRGGGPQALEVELLEDSTDTKPARSTPSGAYKAELTAQVTAQDYLVAVLSPSLNATYPIDYVLAIDLPPDEPAPPAGGCFALPAPSLAVAGVSPEGDFRLAIQNAEAYPDFLFVPSPDLPPCGSNTRASRTWVDITDAQGSRLYGYCAIGSSAELRSTMLLPHGLAPPAVRAIRVRIYDRQCGTSATSGPVSLPGR